MQRFNQKYFEETVENAMRTFNTPAVSAAVVAGGKTIYEAGFGDRINADTLYQIASMSKSMTAAALAQVIEKGLLSWDTRVRDVLPDFRMYDEFATKEMTVKDLLVHRSGLRSEGAGLLWYGSDYSRDEVVRRLRYIRPVTSFRSAYAYQNVMYLAAGEVLEAVSGETWEQYLSKHLFDPLEMTRTVPTLAASSSMENKAVPHAMIRGNIRAIPWRDHDNCGPAASVMSTAHDLANYLNLFLRKGIVNGESILSEESIRALHTAYTLDPNEPGKSFHSRMDTGLPGYGYGWHIQRYAGACLIYHSGGVDGMRCRMALFPDEDFGVVVLTNYENRSTYNALTQTVFDNMLGLEPVDWVSLYAAQPPEEPETIPQQIMGTCPHFGLSQLSGIYRDSAYGEIIVENGVLSFTHSPAFTAELSHYHYDTWKLTWRDPYIPDGLVTFEPGPDGKIASIHFTQPSLLDVHFDELDAHIRKAAN